MQRKRHTRSSPLITVIALTSFALGLGVAEYYPSLFHPKDEAVISSPKIEVCFTPNERCRNLILQEINEAKKNIYVQAYSFTDPLIAQALIGAKERGVIVSLLLDKSNRAGHHSQRETIQREGILVKIDKTQGIAHNKVIIIDEKKIITGSYNFSSAAYKRNAENLLIISDELLALKYIENWHYRWKNAYDD